jgi:hypothetical protein
MFSSDLGFIVLTIPAGFLFILGSVIALFFTIP